MGHDTAVVHNNLSFSLWRRGGRDDYDAAEAAATKALDLDPNCRAAYYNRALARMSLWLTCPGRGQSADEALKDARMAIQGGGRAMLYYSAALLCAAVNSAKC